MQRTIRCRLSLDGYLKATIRLSACVAFFATGAAFAQDGKGSADESLDQLLEGPVTASPNQSPSQPAQGSQKPETGGDQATIPIAPPAGTTSATAGAKQGPSPEASSSATTAVRAPGNRMIEEIVVTAEKREESLQTVPISVSAFSGDMLDARGVDAPTKLQSLAPGLTYNESTGFSIIYLRGVGSDSFLTTDPSVATYIDGIYFPFASGQAQQFDDLKRIEVLKGPQGTLFGRNTTGGAINVFTKEPTPDWHASVQVEDSAYETTKSFSGQKARVFLSGPIFDGLSFSLSGLYDKAHSYYTLDPDSTIQHLPTDVSRGGRAKLRWAPNDRFYIQLAGMNYLQTGLFSALQTDTDPSPLGALLGITPQPRNWTASINAPTSFRISNRVYYGESKLTTDWFDIKALASTQRLFNVGRTDFDGSNQPVIGFSADPLFAHVRTGELQVLSNDNTFGAKYFTWIGGLYLFQSRTGLFPQLGLLGGEQGEIAGIPVLQLLNQLVPGLTNLVPPGIPLLNGVNLNLSGVLDTRSDSAYAQGTGHITDNLDVIVGVRGTREVRSVAQSTVGLAATGNTNIPLFSFDTPTSTAYNFSPKIGLDYKLDDGTLIYSSAQKGFKSGTYNIINIYTNPAYVKPEKVFALELGVKTSLLDDTVRLNAAAFQTTIKDLQVQFVSLLNGGAVSLENAAAVRSRGVDFDTTIRLFPSLIDNLVLNVSGSWIDAIYKDYTDGSGFDPTTGLFTKGMDFSGNPETRTPKYSGTASLGYTYNWDKVSLEFYGDAYYNSGFYYLAQDTNNFKQNAYRVVNAHISAYYEPWKLRATLFCDNLLNEVYDLGEFPNDFGTETTLAPPRTIGLRLHWNYD